MPGAFLRTFRTIITSIVPRRTTKYAGSEQDCPVTGYTVQYNIMKFAKNCLTETGSSSYRIPGAALH